MAEKIAISRRSLLAATTVAAGALLTGKGLVAGTGKIVQPDQASHAALIERAFEMRRLALESGDQGYGAIVVRDGVIVGQSPSHVVVHRDPTAHAEMEAIRDAARRLGTRDLSNCILFSSSHPCPMCEAAAYWANIERMVFGRDARDAGPPGLCA